MAPDIVTKTFEYKILRPSRRFIDAAEKAMESARWVYNSALEQRIMCYRQGRPINHVEQSRELTEARTLPEVGACLRTIQQDALELLDRAFEAFFKRVKQCKAPGFPRFKGARRWVTISQKIQKQRRHPLSGDTLTVPGVGVCRLRLSRPIEGRVKLIRITHRVDGWYALLVCDCPRPQPLPVAGGVVGVDVGLEYFATLSTGQTISNPRYLRRAAKALKRSQRVLARKQKKSANRAKARQRTARRHLQVQRARKDFHYKTALELLRRFDVIRVEDLKVSNMIRHPRLAHSIADAGWGQFLRILTCKAEWAGRLVEKVNPRYTSQTCSSCGYRQKMPLAVRLFACGGCGLSIGRDHNAALMIGRGAPVKPAEPLNQMRRGRRNRFAKKLGAPISPRA